MTAYSPNVSNVINYWKLFANLTTDTFVTHFLSGYASSLEHIEAPCRGAY
jgi:hypothetical protein